MYWKITIVLQSIQTLRYHQCYSYYTLLWKKQFKDTGCIKIITM